MRYFPIFCDMRGREVLVAGGGAVAANKVRLFAKTEARIRVVAASFNGEIQALAAEGRITAEAGDPQTANFGDAAMVIAATESAGDEIIAKRAADEGYLVNAVDKTELCTFITPSIVDRGKTVVAVGTEGAAPVLARRTRERIEALLPERLGELTDFIGRHRERLMALLPETPMRRAFWEKVVDGPIGADILAGRFDAAQEALEREFTRLAAGTDAPPVGRLHVVISPVEDDLLTLRDLRALHDADVIYHADGASEAALDKARRDAERVAVSGERELLKDRLRREAAPSGLRCVLLLPADDRSP